jgi:large subunit ribosomal protein L30
MADLQVKLVKSLIGSTKPQLATANALGLHRIGDVTVQPDNDATKGKIRKLSHLLEVTEVEGGAK